MSFTAILFFVGVGCFVAFGVAATFGTLIIQSRTGRTWLESIYDRWMNGK